MEKIEKKKFLLYANYYYPEVASTAMLSTDLCQGLKEKYDVTVICAVPSYTEIVEEKYQTQRFYYEEHDCVKVIRVRVPSFDKTSKKSRIKNIVSYFINSILATFKVNKPDIIMTQSQPPILGGLLGVIGKFITFLKGKKTKLVYVIQDFNPEQTMAVSYSDSGLVLKAMMILDKFSCVVADKVIVVGKDMVETMKKRFTQKSGNISSKMPKISVINNWMNEKEVYPLESDNEKVVEFKKQYELENKFVVMYSGNIGLFYDLKNIFKVIEKFKDNEDVVFAFVGQGVLKSELEQYTETHGMKNVKFIPYQEKENLVYSMNAADVHWCVNAKGIKGVSCPSKLYGILAVAKPTIAVLEEGTEARDLIETQNCGKVVSPEDYTGIENLINEFINMSQEELDLMGKRGYDFMINNLTKDISVKKYVDEISLL